MATTYGLTTKGFVGKPQSQIISEIQKSLQGVFGQNINFSPSSNMGQLVGIFSEREALLWQLAEAVYSSQYPNGAEGTSVDNILALNNMRRNKATPTVTNPVSVLQNNGITLYGLLLKGSPGTLINANSIIQNNAAPPLQFKTDADVVIQPAVNAIQGIYLSNIPTSGSFSLYAPNGISTSIIPYNALPQISKMFFDSAPSSGAFSISFTLAGAVLSTASLPFGSTASQIQSAIQALSGYGSVTVSGDYSSGFSFNFSSCSNPVLSILANTTGKIISFIQSIQSELNNIIDGSSYPYTDSTIISGSQGYVATFGNGFLVSGQITCGGKPIPLISVNANSLQLGINTTNIKIINSTSGANAQASVNATCISTGPNFVAAGALNVIGTPISGWSSVTNELDCLTGSNVENDTEALIRRTANLQANASGPLLAIIEKVLSVSGVSACIGNENVWLASLQRLDFSGSSSSGSFKISLDGFLTGVIPYNATSAQVQTAIRAVSGYSPTVVKGDITLGFIINFNGSLGGKELPIIQIAQNTTGLVISPSFGLPGKSFEIIAQGGDDLSIAQAILSSKPGGMLAYGETVVTTFDNLGNSYNIGFSRPVPVPIYVSISLVTDLSTSVSPKFNVASISDIQLDVVKIGNAAGIGGLIIGFGSDGLIGAFNSVPGIISYTLNFGRSINPSTNTNIQMQGNESPTLETFLVAISYT